jgi:hypothetical protein
MGKNCELSLLIRLRYFTGQLLTAYNFQDAVYVVCTVIRSGMAL